MVLNFWSYGGPEGLQKCYQTIPREIFKDKANLFWDYHNQHLGQNKIL